MVAYVGAVSADSADSTTTTLALPLPAGSQAGHLAVVVGSWAGGTANPAVAGATMQPVYRSATNTLSAAAGHKVLTADDVTAGSLSFTTGSDNGRAAAALVVLSDAAAPVVGFAADDANDTSQPIPAVTPSGSSLVVAMLAISYNAAGLGTTAPTGWTERADDLTTNASGRKSGVWAAILDAATADPVAATSATTNDAAHAAGWSFAIASATPEPTPAPGPGWYRLTAAGPVAVAAPAPLTRTNLVNGHFEGGSGGWAPQINATLTRETTAARIGTAGARLVSNDATVSRSWYTDPDPATPGQVHVAEGFVRWRTGTTPNRMRLDIQYLNASGTLLTASNSTYTTTTTTGWTRLVPPALAAPANTTQVRLRLLMDVGPAAQAADLDSVQLIAGPSLIPDPGRTLVKADNARLTPGLSVFHQSPPPTSDTQDITYNYWPITDAATTQDFTDSTWSGRHWCFLWANRWEGGWNARANVLPSPRIYVGEHEAGAVFSTLARADAATRVQVRHLCGMSAADVAAPWLAVGGTTADLIPEADVRADPAGTCPETYIVGDETRRVMRDKVLLPEPVFDSPRHAGVVLDYEVQDSRTPAQTTQVLTALAADLHAAGRQLCLYTNTLNGPSQTHTGLDGTNLPAVLDTVDLLSVFLWSGNPEGSIPASYDAQLALLGTLEPAEYAKLALVYELGDPGTTLADARWIYRKTHEPGGPRALIFWRNYAPTGAPLTNHKIAAACLGGIPDATY